MVGGSGISSSLMGIVNWIISSFGLPLATVFCIIAAFLLLSGRAMGVLGGIACGAIGVILFVHAGTLGQMIMNF